MFRHRAGPPTHEDGQSSSEEEDAFAALSSRASKSQNFDKQTTIVAHENGSGTTQPSLPAAVTSSMKRHHGASETRKAKMDALLQELEVEKRRKKPEPSLRSGKRGSFVDPEDEHLTTNLFVGNLAPTITEEQLAELFGQFGELKSVKIMWPRTPEERARNRHNGFVCFRNRRDAEVAMDTYDETDPFQVGRRIMLRWGKHMLHQTQPFETIAMPATKKPRKSFDEQEKKNIDLEMHQHRIVRVVSPRSRSRADFITTVASYVAKDGSQIEQKILAREKHNPNFHFMAYRPGALPEENNEHIFYKWRVFSYCHGGTQDVWDTSPFEMFDHHGCLWIPPSCNSNVDKQTALDSRTNQEQAEADRVINGPRSFKGARSKKTEGSIQLTEEELSQFIDLTRKKLSMSRESVCEAMAFCYEKGAAAKQISNLLKDMMLESGPDIKIGTRIARLYLLSDVLFNSQQPGVKNAFLYRSEIEAMAPQVFHSLGVYGRQSLGRLTMTKLSSAVSSVLGAWTNWSVYNPVLLDELYALYEGREPQKEDKALLVAPKEEEVDSNRKVQGGDDIESTKMFNPPAQVGSEGGRVLNPTSISGRWKPIPHEAEAKGISSDHDIDVDNSNGAPGKVDGEPVAKSDGQAFRLIDINSVNDAKTDHLDDVDGQPVDDVDGEALDDVDGQPLDDDVDGEALDNMDGQPLDRDVDGEALDDVDGQPLDDDVDGEALDDVDGDPLDDDMDGEAIDDVDGLPLDDVDGDGHGKRDT